MKLSDQVRNLEEKLAKAEAVAANAIMQAQGWKMEAMGANHSLHKAYQAITGSTGEPGNWNGAKPIIDFVKRAA